MNMVRKKSAFPKTVQSGIPKLGELPSGWTCASLRDYLHEVRRPVDMSDDGSYRLVTVKRARGGVVEREILLGRGISVKSQFWIEAGDFLISKRQIVHGACGIVPKELEGSIVSNEYAVLHGNEDIDIEFLNHLAHSAYFQQTCFHSSIGVHIEKMIFKLPWWFAFDYHLPPLSEQKKISQILSTWDRTIETVEHLIANAQDQKKALMQELLTGEKRFKKFEGQVWREVRLEDIANINPRKPERPDNGVVSFLPMEAVSEAAEILELADDSYDRVKKGFTAFKDHDVLIAKITPCFENGKGAFAIDLTNGIGFGSTEFHVLRAKKGTDSRFLYHITNSSDFRGRGELNMQGSAGQKRVPTDFLRAYHLTVPQLIDEQKKISTVLDSSTEELCLLEVAHRNLVIQKKALMQKLLTGKRRVKVEEIANA